MAWQVETSPRFEKQLRSLDKAVLVQVKKSLENLSRFPEPQKHCKALTGPLAGYWRYRAGKDYRLILDFHQGRAVILALEVVHRSKAYR